MNFSRRHQQFNLTHMIKLCRSSTEFNDFINFIFNLKHIYGLEQQILQTSSKLQSDWLKNVQKLHKSQTESQII